MTIIADSFNGKPPRIITDPFVAIPEDVIRAAAANGDETAQAELDRRNTLTVTKDRTSGATQPHGEHGHFASEGGAEPWQRTDRSDDTERSHKFITDHIDAVTVGEGHTGIESIGRTQLTKDQADAVSMYTGSGFIPMNHRLRNGMAIEDVPRAADLQSAIDSSTIDRPVTVFRTISPRLLTDLHEGDIISDRGFISTSVLRSVAEIFTTTGDNIAEITVPEGSHCVGALRSDDRSESEIILSSGSQFRVDQDASSGGPFKLTYIGRDDGTGTVTKAVMTTGTRFTWNDGDITVERKRDHG